jgi:hypothetical protein
MCMGPAIWNLQVIVSKARAASEMTESSAIPPHPRDSHSQSFSHVSTFSAAFAVAEFLDGFTGGALGLFAW